MARPFVALALIACGSTPELVDSACTDCADSRMYAVQWECTADDWTYSVGVEGWASAVDVDSFFASMWDGGSNVGIPAEHHELAAVEWAEDGSWTRWSVTLPIVAPDAQQDGLTTALVCEVHTPREVAFRARLFMDERVADCGIWGQRSHDYYNVALGGECYCFDQERGCESW